MGAAGAEMRGAVGAEIEFLRDVDIGAEVGEAGRAGFGGVDALDAVTQGQGDFGGGEIGFGFEQGEAPIVGLAKDPGGVGGAVEDGLDLGFDEGLFFLDDDDFFEAVGEGADDVGFERPGHAEFEHADAGEGEVGAGLFDIEEGFAGGDDADAGAGGGIDDAVDRIGADEVEQGGVADAEDP